jgi:putative peptidoglycan lipid II flippase
MQALTISLLRILLIAPTVFGVSGIFMGILNAHQIFLWPALAPSMLWLGMIIGVLFFAPVMGIFGLAWGYVLGAFMHLGIQIPAILQIPARKYTATLGLRLPAVREVGRLMGPRLLGVAAVQINFVVNTFLATGMAVGSLSAIKYSWAIMTMPQVVIAQSIAIAALPTFSAQVALGELEKMRSSLGGTLRGVILLSLPASFGLIILRLPLITTLFQRGAFTAESTELVAWALIWYTIGLTGHGVVEILSRAFYAMHDTKTPVFVGVAAMSLNILLSLAFAEAFDRVGWYAFGGLALANTVATGLEMIALWAIMTRRLNGLDWNGILEVFLKTGIASIVMGLTLWVWLRATTSMNDWFVLIGGILLGAGIFGLTLIALRLREGKQIADFLRVKIIRTR